MRTRTAHWFGLLCIAAAGGCYDGLSATAGTFGPGLSGGDGADGGGADGAGDGADDGGGGDDGDDPEASCAGEPLEVGPSSILRLSRSQYANALRDLLSLDALADELADELPADEKLGAFTFNASGVPSLIADTALRNAEAAADDFVSRLDQVLPCSVANADEACAEQLIDDVGTRAFRRALEPVERQEFLALFAQGAETSFSEGIRQVVAALLTSPTFLYRVEIGEGEAAPGERFVLTGYEVAARMSFLLWDSIPDQVLLDAAAAGELSTAEGRRAQAERLLASPRAQARVAQFHREWTGIDTVHQRERDPDLYPDFDAALAQAMADETDAFVQRVVFDGDGSFETLMTDASTVADDDLLRLYGVEPEAGRDPTQPVQLDPEQRGGLLTQASFLTATAHRDQASPILRGISVRTNFLCQGLPPPPADVDDEPPEVDENGTTRERFEQHTADPSCAACHELIDPIGFGFSHYDAVGAFVTEENGAPVDATGELVSAGDVSGTFDGAVELGQMLAGSERAQRCYAEQWFVFANGRRMVPADACSLETAYTAFSEAGDNIPELILAAVASPTFTHRVIADITEGE